MTGVVLALFATEGCELVTVVSYVQYEDKGGSQAHLEEKLELDNGLIGTDSESEPLALRTDAREARLSETTLLDAADVV